MSDQPPTRDQLDALIDHRAGIIAGRMIGQALHGAAERIASAIVGGPVVVLPVLHMPNLVAEERQPSPGKAAHVSGGSKS